MTQSGTRPRGGRFATRALRPLMALLQLAVTGCINAKSTVPNPRAGMERGGIDARPGHLLYRVEPEAIQSAIRQFERVGFSVVRGGPDDELVNAMIHLEDGWFIELFGLGPELRVLVPLLIARAVDPVAAARFSALIAASPGRFIDWSIDVADVAAARTFLEVRGVPVSPPRAFRRRQTDGSWTEWELAMPAARAVPFLKSPYRAHLPLPDTARRHANGASGLSEIWIGSPTPTVTLAELSHVGELSARGVTVGGALVRVQDSPLPGIRRVALHAPVVAPREVLIEGRATGLWLVPEARMGDYE